MLLTYSRTLIVNINSSNIPRWKYPRSVRVHDTSWGPDVRTSPSVAGCRATGGRGRLWRSATTAVNAVHCRKPRGSRLASLGNPIWPVGRPGRRAAVVTAEPQVPGDPRTISCAIVRDAKPNHDDALYYSCRVRAPSGPPAPGNRIVLAHRDGIIAVSAENVRPVVLLQSSLVTQCNAMTGDVWGGTRIIPREPRRLTLYFYLFIFFFVFDSAVHVPTVRSNAVRKLRRSFFSRRLSIEAFFDFDKSTYVLLTNRPVENTTRLRARPNSETRTAIWCTRASGR